MRGKSKLKKCSRCKIFQHTTNFPPNPSMKDGFHPYCRICKRASDSKYYRTPKGRARVSKATRDYAMRKLDIVVIGSYTGEEWQALLDFCDNKCLKCGTTEELSADHILPILLGGTHTIDNIQILCRRCNSAKGSRYIDYRPQPFPLDRIS